MFSIPPANNVLRSLMHFNPHLAPATLQPRVMAFCIECPLFKAYIQLPLNVSPAPSVSTTRTGGNVWETNSSPSPVDAAAPSSPQAHITVALKERKSVIKQNRSSSKRKLKLKTCSFFKLSLGSDIFCMLVC